MEIKTYWFNTGVLPQNCLDKSGKPILFGLEQWRNGTKQVPYKVINPPEENHTVMFLCDNPSLEESKLSNVKVCEVIEEKGGMLSKYVYFQLIK